MKKIADKIPLLICSSIMLFSVGGKVIPVLAVLAAVSISSLCQASDNRAVTIGAQIFYIILCVIDPLFLFCFPVVLYDILEKRRYLLCGAAAVVFIVNMMSFETVQVIYLAGLVSGTVIIQKRTEELEQVTKKLIVTRDTSTELNMVLSEKNQQLINNQDYEIHLATLKERNRIAREIHDNVGHLLSRSILQAGALGFISDDELRKESLSSLSETLNNAMTTIRRSVHDLHDDSIDLKQTLNEIIGSLNEKGVKVSTELECSEAMTNEAKLCIIGVVKEAVSNIIKHSSCTQVNITLIEHPAFRQLKIHDNGECSEEISHSGIGLLNMRERVERLGGIITFNSGKSGFDIFVSLRKEI